jgi:hypothetical protein
MRFSCLNHIALEEAVEVVPLADRAITVCKWSVQSVNISLPTDAHDQRVNVWHTYNLCEKESLPMRSSPLSILFQHTRQLARLLDAYSALKLCDHARRE